MNLFLNIILIFNKDTMSNNTNNSISGINNICLTKFDPKSKKFILANHVEITKCCLETNSKYINLCRDSCLKNFSDKNKQSTCLIDCNHKAYMNNNICKRVSNLWGEFNPYTICGKELGCGKNSKDINYLNKKCVKKNKDLIMNCCLENCTQKNLKNLYACNDHCMVSYLGIVNPNKLNPLFKQLQNVKYNSILTTKTSPLNIIKSSKLKFYIIVIIIIIIIIILIYLFIKFKYCHINNSSKSFHSPLISNSKTSQRFYFKF
jgi:hypothetical protein